MRRPGRLLTPLLLALAPAARAEVFFSPGLEAAGGYASNRFLDSQEDGSAFYRLAPSLTVTTFAAGGAELGLALRHARTAYTESGFGWLAETRGEASISAPLGRATGSLAVSAGLYTDDALPADDARWGTLAPALAWGAGSGVTLSLSTPLTVTRYDSQETARGDEQRDTRWEVRPGVLWVLCPKARLWAQAFGELNRSNEPTEEYEGFGAELGFDARVLDAARVGVWLRYGARDYRDDGGGESRRDTPLGAGLWAACRLAPWAELTAAASRTHHRSTEGADDYDAWSAEAGLRLVYDWEATGER